jgi:hypothetical protein
LGARPDPPNLIRIMPAKGETHMTPFDPATRTRTVARIVGPYLIVIALALFARADTLALVFPAFMQDGPLVLATGAFTLIACLTLVAAHHHWNSPAAIVISLIGIVGALKGAWLMIAPDFGAAVTNAVVAAPPTLLIAAGLELLVGAWLTFVGWLAKPAA